MFNRSIKVNDDLHYESINIPKIIRDSDMILSVYKFIGEPVYTVLGTSVSKCTLISISYTIDKIILNFDGGTTYTISNKYAFNDIFFDREEAERELKRRSIQNVKR